MKQILKKYSHLPSVKPLTKPTILEKYREHIEEQADIYLMPNVEIPTYEASLYNQFFETGKRDGYESKFGQIRAALMWLSLGATINPTRYTDKLTSVVEAVLAEPTWVLPAHSKHVWAQDNDPPHVCIDWGSAQTAAWLGSAVLSGVLSYELRDKVIAETKLRIFDIISNIALLKRQFWFGDKSVYKSSEILNLTAWNITNTLYAAACMLGESELQNIAYYVALTLDRFASECVTDGFCKEGVNYWTAGVGSWLDGLMLFNKLSDGEINVFDDPIFGNVLDYPLAMTVEGEKTFNIGDSRNGGRSPFNWFILYADFLASQGHDASDVKTWASNGLRGVKPDGVKCADARFAYKSHLLLSTDYSATPGKLTKKSDYYEDAQILIVRESADRITNAGFTVLAKGGHNGEGGHNHNDVGEVVVYHNGKPILIDLGVGKYTSKSFRTDTRYTLINCMSNFHNCAKIGKCYQSHGENFYAEVIDTDENYINFNLSNAYSSDANIENYTREISLKNGEVTVIDTVKVEKDSEIKYVWIVGNAPEILDDNKLVVGDVVFEFDERLTAEIEEIEQNVYETSNLSNSNGVLALYRIRLNGNLNADIEYKHTLRLNKRG